MDPGIEVLFETHAPPKQYAMQDIFLIHGFVGPRYGQYREILEGWVSNLARTATTPATARVFRFDGSSTPVEGKHALEDEVWRLRRFLIQQWQFVDEDVRVSRRGEDHSFQPGTVSENQPPPNRSTIMFIAHGLGSWVLKDVLAHPIGDSIVYSYESTEVTFLDLDIEEGIEDPYRQYLERNWGAFKFGLSILQSDVELEELISYLQEIDDNFHAFRDTYNVTDRVNMHVGSRLISQTIYQGQGLAIWMSDKKLIDPDKPLRTVRFPWLWLGKQVPATRAQQIGKLPSSLEEMRHLTTLLMTARHFNSSESVDESVRTPNKHWPLVSPITAREEGYQSSERHAVSPSLTTDPLRARDVSGYFSQTVARPSSSARHLADEDGQSAVSIPNQEFSMSNSHILSAYRQANSFLQTGELENAGVLFEKILKLPSLRDQSPEQIHISLQIAAVKMYRGYYKESRIDFQDIEKRLEGFRASGISFQSNDELYFDCRRWLASCRLLAGQWEEAKTEMQSLLEDHPTSDHVRLNRDLALAYGYLGLYGEARKTLKLAHESEQSERKSDIVAEVTQSKSPFPGQDDISRGRGQNRKETPSSDGKHNRTKESSLQVAQASINMLAGNYTTALDKSTKALDAMKKAVGPKHFKTLAIATLKAWCLAHNGRYNEAETLCCATYKATTQALGRRHPQTLEAMGCLVYIYKCQCRFAEAIGTGISLESLSAEWVADQDQDHPLAIHSKFLLAISLFANGDYATAKIKIDTTVDQAERAIGKTHPETLRYKSEQARILLYLGNISEAEDLACLVVAQQFEKYIENQNDTNKGIADQNQNDTDQVIADICKTLETGPREGRLSRLNELLDMVLRKTPQSTLHPFLVTTLRLMANIEVRKYRLTGRKDESADLATATAILMTLQFSYSKTKREENRVLADSVDLDLATLQKQSSTQPRDLLKAVELYTKAYQDRKSLMGDNHIDTLCTLRELTITQCLHDLSGSNPEEFPIDRVKTTSDGILKTLEARLGLPHPETLTSRLWCITVDRLLRDNSSGIEQRTCKDLIEMLSDPQIVKERLIESLVMRRQLVGLLNGTGNSQEALELIARAISDVETAETVRANEGLREVLSDLKKAFLGLR